MQIHWACTKKAKKEQKAKSYLPTRKWVILSSNLHNDDGNVSFVAREKIVPFWFSASSWKLWSWAEGFMAAALLVPAFFFFFWQAIASIPGYTKDTWLTKPQTHSRITGGWHSRFEGHFVGMEGGKKKVPLGPEEAQTWLRGGSLCHLWQHQLSFFYSPLGHIICTLPVDCQFSVDGWHDWCSQVSGKEKSRQSLSRKHVYNKLCPPRGCTHNRKKIWNTKCSK